VLTRGRWTWQPRLNVPADICLPAVLCPACQRIRDKDPHHLLRVEGASAAQEKALRALARRVERAESATHPQERLVPVEGDDGAVAIGTTGPHLARRLLSAVRRTWKREVVVVRTNDVETRLRWQTTKAPRAR